MDFPGDPDSKESACNEDELGLIPGLGLIFYLTNTLQIFSSGL